MMNLQHLVDGMSEKWQKERAETQMTLGGLIKALEAMPSDRGIQNIGDPISYRGYYRDLAFQPDAGKTTAGELLAVCRGCMGKVFEGYKGGDYLMGESTPVWISDYGTTGLKIIGIDADGNFVTQEDD